MKIHSLLLVFILSTHAYFAQKSNIGNWFVYFGNQKINNKFWWHNEVQVRNYNLLGDLNQLLLRTGLGFNLTENNNSILAGYGFIHNQRYLPNSTIKIRTDEHRVFQQFITRHNWKRFFIQHRFRIEERFLNTDFQLRFRYFLAVNIPLNNKIMDKNTFYLSAYNETFLIADPQPFDQNRLYGALGYMINQKLKIEVGYMNQTTLNGSNNQFQVVIFNNFPLTNKKQNENINERNAIGN